MFLVKLQYGMLKIAQRVTYQETQKLQGTVFMSVVVKQQMYVSLHLNNYWKMMIYQKGNCLPIR